jgi:hypothetical protein
MEADLVYIEHQLLAVTGGRGGVELSPDDITFYPWPPQRPTIDLFYKNNRSVNPMIRNV